MTEVIGEYEGRRVARMLRQLFLAHLEPGEGFTVKGHATGGWVHVSFSLTGGPRDYPVEARVDAKRHGLRQSDAKDALLDLLGHCFGEYLAGGRAPFTGPKWEEVDLAGTAVFVRGQERMPDAEAQATAMLAADARALAAAARTPGAAADPGGGPAER